MILLHVFDVFLLFSLSPIHYLFGLTSQSIRLPLKANDVKIFLMNAQICCNCGCTSKLMWYYF